MRQSRFGNCVHKNKYFNLIFILYLIITTNYAQAQFGGGSGEPSDPYLIYDPNQMNAIGADPNTWDKHFKLMADIDLSQFTGTEFNLIGIDWNSPFKGMFDGNGHTISSFNYSSTGINNIGLFSYVESESAVIKNTIMKAPNINAVQGFATGALVGAFNDGKILNCGIDGGTVSGHDGVGGLAGMVGWSGGYLINCYSSADIIGTGEYIGGLVGYCDIELFGEINNCFALGSVSGDRFVGGLFGFFAWGLLENSFARGSVFGNSDVGGLVGAGRSVQINHSFSTGAISGGNYVGGLIGSEFFGPIQGSGNFWDILTSGISTSVYGQGKTTIEMVTQSTFTNAGWDFVYESTNGSEDIWYICENNYPKLASHRLPGDLVCPDGVNVIDLMVMVDEWLNPNPMFNDFAPDGGDDFFDLIDFAVLSQNWLETGPTP